MKPVFLSSARKVVNARSYRISALPPGFLLAPCVDSQSRRVQQMVGRNISIRIEERGGVQVEVNVKTGRGVGVRKNQDKQELLGGSPPEPDEERWVGENIDSRWFGCTGTG